jgi:hypothetical protein
VTDNTRRISAYARQAGVLTAAGRPDIERYQMTPAQLRRVWKKTRRHFATPARLLASADRATARAGRQARLENRARGFLGSRRGRAKITPVPAGSMPFAGPGPAPLAELRAGLARHTAMARPQGDR